MKTLTLEKLYYWESKDDFWELCRQGDFYFVRYDRGETTKVETSGNGREGLETIIEHFTKPHPVQAEWDSGEHYEIVKHLWFKEMEFVCLCKKYLKKLG